MKLEDEIVDGPLTLTMILKSCGVGGWNPWDLLLPSTFSSDFAIIATSSRYRSLRNLR